LIKVLGSTLSVRVTGREHLDTARGNGGNVIYAFWHEGLAVATYVFRNQQIRVLVSQHKDGEYISRAIERMGYSTVRGSTTRGGTRALFRMASDGSSGVDLGITVDGPRGPALQVQSGVLYIARRSGLPIVPFAVACSTKKTVASWDRFMVPFPFSRAVVTIGPALIVPARSTRDVMEVLRVELEQRLLQIRKSAIQETRQGKDVHP